MGHRAGTERRAGGFARCPASRLAADPGERRIRVCTAAFVPFPGEGYLLGHNRDERRTRARGRPPSRRSVASVAYLAPSDPEGGGSWCAINDSGLGVCLLNGADRPDRVFSDTPPSRGLLIERAIRYRAAEEALGSLTRTPSDLGPYRAFTLVLADPGEREGRPRLASMRWDGEALVTATHEGPALFVSSTYDPEAVRRAREKAWRRFIQSPASEKPSSLAAWLAGHEPARGPLSVCMHRPDASTVARSLLRVGRGSIEYAYLDGQPCAADGDEIRITL